MKQLEMGLETMKAVERRGRFVCTREDGSQFITSVLPTGATLEKEEKPVKAKKKSFLSSKNDPKTAA